MSRASDPLNTIIGLALTFFVITIVLPVIAGTAGVMYAVNTITYGLLPKAELPRNNKGEFVVTLENHTHWHTMAKVEAAKNNSAYLLGQYVVRAFPRILETCNGIQHCESYTSEFVALDYKNADVYLLTKQDDKLFSQAMSSLSSRVQAHNEQLKGNFDLNIAFEGVDELEKISDQLALLEKMDSLSDPKNHAQKVHANVVQYAKNNCRNNGIGCSVKATLIYDYSVFGGPDFLLTR
ncbi:hypothetical protein [Photobacterium sanguinicancri]|uniref:hypothetical protein n=1 Tax=Photobacterium sanguinicancri TaxID=875932 RepID=UPI0021C37075|nr:hypothetical protein [Photobacterium sanguinicancri]